MIRYIDLNCEFCKKQFKKPIGIYNGGLKRGQTKFYCCPKCKHENDRSLSQIKLKCQQCNTEIIKITSEIKNTRHSFCNSSCAAIYNNSIRSKNAQMLGVCSYCSQPIMVSSWKYKSQKKHFCGVVCQTKYKKKTQFVLVSCESCKNQFYRSKSSYARSVRNNTLVFCSRSCRARHFQNAGQFICKTGTSRSQLEVWLEDQLIIHYPHIEFHFNQKDAIGSELDIYIPSMKLAFEINGIFHYEPVFGDEKLNKIQSNDDRKFTACKTAGISLCVIDSSGQRRVTNKSSQKYLDIIHQIIKKHTTSPPR